MKTLDVIKTELECVQRCCNRDCKNCDLVLPLKEIVKAYKDVISDFEGKEKSNTEKFYEICKFIVTLCGTVLAVLFTGTMIFIALM